MLFESFFGKKRTNLFTEFASTSFADIIKQGVSALGTIVFHSTAWGAILGIGVKGIVDALFVKASQLEKKIDKLLQQPFLNGITLLQHGLLHDDDTKDEREGRQTLLDNAHNNFVSAYNLSLDSLEDKTFIFTLDCLTLAANPKHKSLVKQLRSECERKIVEFEESVLAYENESFVTLKQGERTKIYLYGRDEWMDKPVGFPEQKLFWKKFLKEVKKIEDLIVQNKVKVEILRNLYQLICILSDD